MANSRTVISFNNDWKFKLGKYPAAVKETFDDAEFENVSLPHDWSIQGVFKREYSTTARGGYRPAGFGTYRKVFTVEKEYKGKKIELEFGGIFRKATVIINGKKAAYWNNGYITKTVDISNLINFSKENILVVTADSTEQPASRYYTGCGIYRDVNLIIRDNVFIDPKEPFITTVKANEENAVINIKTKIKNKSVNDANVKILYSIINKAGKTVKEAYTDEFIIPCGKFHNCNDALEIATPDLWDTENPNLYKLETTVITNGKITDFCSTKFGIREILFKRNSGFFLNGKNVYIKGACIHHDNGCLGAAAYPCAEKRKLLTMKEMGCNAIRLSHNPVSESFLDLCDEMGFLVMDEFFDEWNFPKFPPILNYENSPDKVIIQNYYKYFDDNYKSDLTSTLIRDRNHPSIIMYSIGNEIPEQRRCMLDGEKTAKTLMKLVKKYDKTRPVTAACCFDQPHSEETGFCDILDIAGYNYAEVLYEKHHKQFKRRTIIGSEDTSISTFKKRGEYDYAMLCKTNEKMDLKIGEALTSESDRIKSAEYSMRMHMNTPYVSGFFIWTGIDYLGEPTPYCWPSRSSYFGATDTCCFPKDAFYFYKSFWSNEKVLHLFPHWNLDFKKGEIVTVYAYTNCKKVELLLNGKSMGIAEYNVENGEHLHWDIPFEKGELKAIGYDENGKKCAEDTVITANEPKSLRLTADKTQIENDGRDLVFVKAELLDENGNIVPTTPKTVNFYSDGLKILGVDNGDPEYTGDLTDNKIPTLGGLCLCVLSSNNSSGVYKLKAEIDGLCSSDITIKVK